ncbi:hypothetical protein BD769DRAFT_1666384 [Suillus cothurnatus]|nr:hypothetical protein BD769DRAFT_1666384 [Suillus cothurnatus]
MEEEYRRTSVGTIPPPPAPNNPSKGRRSIGAPVCALYLPPAPNNPSKGRRSIGAPVWALYLPLQPDRHPHCLLFLHWPAPFLASGFSPRALRLELLRLELLRSRLLRLELLRLELYGSSFYARASRLELLPSQASTLVLPSRALLPLGSCLLPMPPKKKNTAKKSAGGTADRLSGPLGSPVRNGEEVLLTVSAEPELPAETHSLWCLICHDGAEVTVSMSLPTIWMLYDTPTSFLSACPVILSVPAENWLPTFANLPEKGGHPVLPDFLELRGKFETALCSLLASTPIAIIHFIVGANDEVITPVPILSHYLEHFYPNGGYTYLEVVFDIATYKKINEYTRQQDDSGWLFAGKVNGNFVAISVSQVLSTVFAPYLSLLKAANIVFLVCGSIVTYEDSFVELKQAILDLKVASAIVFPAKRFQPLVATNFLLAMAELIMVEQLNLQKVFLTLLSLSNHLGQHTNIIVMTTMDDAINGTQLSVTTFSRAPTHKQSHGALRSLPNALSVDQQTATVINYVYICTYIDCGKRQGKSPHRFDIAKPPGFLIGAAKSKTSGWFQSPSTIFPPPPPVQSSPILPTSSITKAKRCSEGVEMTESTRKRACN